MNLGEDVFVSTLTAAHRSINLSLLLGIGVTVARLTLDQLV